MAFDERLSPDRPRSWLAKWVREEKFWQEVTTRALAAAIVAALGYVFALLTGYLSTPSFGRFVLSSVGLLVAIGGGVGINLLMYRLFAANRGAPSALVAVFTLVNLPVSLLYLYGVVWVFELL